MFYTILILISLALVLAIRHFMPRNKEKETAEDMTEAYKNTNEIDDWEKAEENAQDLLRKAKELFKSFKN